MIAATARAASLALGLALAAQVAAQPADPRELGKREFESNCATCHGLTGEGDGPMRAFLVRPPTDLTTLARRSGGTFPRVDVAALIDGRGVPGPGPHGTRDMPVWGRVYREQAEHDLRGVPFPREWTVQGRILALVDYLATLQKP
jgi:mono/diheme cytochrome c family protein